MLFTVSNPVIVRWRSESSLSTGDQHCDWLTDWFSMLQMQIVVHYLYLWGGQHANGWLSGCKRRDYQNCTPLYCVLKLCTVISTLRWAVIVLWIGFCHTGPISLCIDLFVFTCVYFVRFCFILHRCCIIVSTVGWTWWDWSLVPWTYLPSVLRHCWFGHLTHKNLSPMTYNVFGGTLNLAQSSNQSVNLAR